MTSSRILPLTGQLLFRLPDRSSFSQLKTAACSQEHCTDIQELFFAQHHDLKLCPEVPFQSHEHRIEVVFAGQAPFFDDISRKDGEASIPQKTPCGTLNKKLFICFWKINDTNYQEPKLIATRSFAGL